MKRLLLTSILITSGMGMSAQPSTDTLQSSIFNLQSSINDVKRSDPWLTSSNAAALVRFDEKNIAEAELSLTKAKGGLTNFDGAPDVLQGDASVESFFRLNQRAVVFGSMSYSNFSGKDMAGSAFIPASAAVPAVSPAGNSHRPFDLVEWTEFDKQDSLLENTGTKHLDTYRLMGGFGYSVTEGFAVGARVDYTAANYAKYKDLRHQNKLMDLQLTAGIYAPVAPWLQVGAHYQYHRNTESVLFSTFGKTDKVYKTLIDYANFTGQVEQFGGDGFTDKSREMPLVNDYNGVGMQFNVQCSMFNLYNAFSYTHRQGYYGRKSPYTITYTNHTSHCYSYDARLTHVGNFACLIPSKSFRQSLELHLQVENLQNDGATYRDMKNDAGATYYEYYTPVKTANKLWVEGTVAYTLDVFSGQRFQALQRGMQSLEASPTWTLQMGMNWLHRKQTAYLYPYARRQRLTVYEPFVSVCRNFIATKSNAVWSLALDASFRTGNGEPYEDFSLGGRELSMSHSASDGASITASDAPIPTMEAYLWREYQWLTAAQYQIGGSVKYAFPLKSLSAVRPYVKASVSHRKANETFEYSNGRDRTTATIAVGCNF